MESELLANPRRAVATAADRKLWLETYHKRISRLRSALRRDPSAKDELAAVLNEAEDVYSRLLQVLLHEHLGDEDEACARALGSDGVSRRFVVLASAPSASDDEAIRTTCARCLVYLGDIRRYRCIHLRTACKAGAEGSVLASVPPLELLGCQHGEFQPAARCYQRALRLSLAHAGSAHNQLAVLSETVGDRATAVMHYLCALSAERPFEVARENMARLISKVPAPHASNPSSAAAAVDCACCALGRLFADASDASVGDISSTLNEAITRVAGHALKRTLSACAAQPLLLSAVCLAHKAIGDVSDAAPRMTELQSTSATALLDLVNALEPLLQSPANTLDTACEPHGADESARCALLDVLDADTSGESAEITRDEVRPLGAGEPLRSLMQVCDTLRGVLPALMWVCVNPRILTNSPLASTTAFARALVSLWTRTKAETWSSTRQPATMRNAAITPLHLSLVSLQPVAITLSGILRGNRKDGAATAATAATQAVGEPMAGDLASIAAVEEGLRGEVRHYISLLARSPEMPQAVSELLHPVVDSFGVPLAAQPAATNANISQAQLVAPPRTTDVAAPLQEPDDTAPYQRIYQTSGAAKRVRIWPRPFGFVPANAGPRATQDVDKQADVLPGEAVAYSWLTSRPQT